ncbi:TetR family transcriptional regulator [Nocardia sp. SYP-A9097]|uniref:TetR/AcrR family transcriptional regulator n=1 Tax=Nocardia sp. SYP-A9097 TaxID=2663237 RepID=UPI00129A103F|nr:TetR/AcrR family transcriptional regulator [Nocardia sp. SYP-A9097]MRH91311.1 TetR family transcriptional regulator [Nocardia sp. SYP-A9097]
MSAPLSNNMEATRRRLTGKQAETVERLSRAAVTVLTREGYAGTTIRLIAAEAGIGTATAYTYFSSKEHLIAEVYWRRLAAMPPAELPDADNATRAIAVLRQAAMLVADEPALAAAIGQALLGSDPDVAHLRVRIGGELRTRLVEAVGSENAESLEYLELLYYGAMLRAGMGHMSYTDVADRMEKCIHLLLA